MLLTGKQKHYLRGLAHHSKPVVIIGNAGLSEMVSNEIDQALNAHELIKIKLPGGDRNERQSLLEKICEATTAESVQSIGNIIVIYRPAKKPEISLPK